MAPPASTTAWRGDAGAGLLPRGGRGDDGAALLPALCVTPARRAMRRLLRASNNSPRAFFGSGFGSRVATPESLLSAALALLAGGLPGRDRLAGGALVSGIPCSSLSARLSIMRSAFCLSPQSSSRSSSDSPGPFRPRPSTGTREEACASARLPAQMDLMYSSLALQLSKRRSSNLSATASLACFVRAALSSFLLASASACSSCADAKGRATGFALPLRCSRRNAMLVEEPPSATMRDSFLAQAMVMCIWQMRW
mmetsp:Transcript_9/g.11  ORF Transcript_9/g.11 Transcript_9/m.11 type:complete len:254 (-) Transcript_9:7-768(-)